MPDQLAEKRDRLLELLRGYGRCAVAYSGGVDSAVVAKAAVLALGDRVVALTGVSPSLADGELQRARQTARLIGIRHEEIGTEELANPDYTRNAPDRCFHCKTELYSRMRGLASKYHFSVIVNGANADDLGDYRPGLQAAAEHDVRSPLAECGLSKFDVRELARQWNLPVWDKPATPCLSSRVAYGEAVTPERLAMIDQAEQFLRQHDFQGVRVRYHAHDLARIEVALADLPRLCQPELRAALAARFREIGFRFMTLDLEGFRSGNLNQLVPLDARRVV